MSRVPLSFAQARQAAETHWRLPLEQRMAELLQKAELRLEKRFQKPKLEFSQRGTIAGSARLQANLIRLHPVLLWQSPEEFMEQILPHELAHLLVHQYYGRAAPHGIEWQQLMVNVFERPAQRTHQLDVSQVQGKSFAYACACQTHQLTIRRHNKVLKGASYRCRGCGQELVASQA